MASITWQGHGRLKVCFASFVAQKYFFPWIKCFIKHWVLDLTLALALVTKLFHFMLSGTSALCCSDSVDTAPHTGICSLQDVYLPVAWAQPRWDPVQQFLWPDFLLNVWWLFLHFPPEQLIVEQVSGYLTASLNQKGHAHRIHPCLNYKYFVLDK